MPLRQFIRVQSVEPGEPGHVRVVFTNGEQRDIDLAPYIADGPMVEPVRNDIAFFQAAQVEGGTSRGQTVLILTLRSCTVAGYHHGQRTEDDCGSTTIRCSQRVVLDMRCHQLQKPPNMRMVRNPLKARVSLVGSHGPP